MRICVMNMAAAKDISGWKYEAPYEIYSLDGSQECIEELMNGSYYIAVDENRKLFGYICFGQSARVPAGICTGAYDRKDVTDIGLGLRPDLCGNGLGLSLLMAGLEYGKKLFENHGFRLTVATFNIRAMKVYERGGFIIDKTFERISSVGSTEFQTMIKSF